MSDETDNTDDGRTIPWTGFARNDPLAGQQCQGHNRQGERCKNKPIIGGLVCRMHGGGTPLAKKAAKMRLLAMVEPAFQVLLDAMAGTDDALAVKAAKIVLDRAGFGPSSKVVVTDEREDYSNLSREELALKAEEIVRELREDAPDVVSVTVERDADIVH